MSLLWKRYDMQPGVGVAGFHSGSLSQRRCVVIMALRKKQDSISVGIFGAGAAGLASAWFATGNLSARVTLYEKTEESGKKILISGGSRCNILPGSVSTEDFFTESKAGCLRSIFGQWSLQECREWLEVDVGIEMKYEEETNKVFPVSDSGKLVRNQLLGSCLERGVDVVYGKDVVHIEHDQEHFVCTFKDGSRAVHDRIVLATGGKSFPTLGTIGTGYDILRNIGHQIRTPYPVLTPLKGSIPGASCNQDNPYELAGISLSNADLFVKMKQQSTGKSKRKARNIHAKRADVLFTHRGFSGPSVLDLSQYYTMASERNEIVPEYYISWNKSMSYEQWRSALSSVDPKSRMTSCIKNCGHIPIRLSKTLCEESGIPEDRIVAELRREERENILERLVNYPLSIDGHEGFSKSEATGGGVHLEEIDCTTMESRIQSGLFICGELCDVHGRIGGFNFYFAWLSGKLAGMNASSYIA
jgi:predicted Rossmann fold flavoprotein